MDKSLCAGCTVHEIERKGSIIKCETKALGRADECPCIICPVKVMCRASCEAYRKLRVDTTRKYREQHE